jgi:uncharacterized protein YndB with AHSA1/START domain
MIKVKDVQPKPDHRLVLTFSDGTTGEVSLADMVTKPHFKTLKDDKIFNAVYVEHGAVCWPGDLDLATEFLYARAHGLPTPETFEQAKENELEMSLRELRRMAGKTQTEISADLGMGQGELSRFENREDHRLSTLRRYVESIGGELEVAAVFGDKRISLRGV